MNNYKQELEDWSKSGVPFLKAFYLQNCENLNFVDDILHLLVSESEYRSPAAWIIKYHLEQKKAKLNEEQSVVLLSNLNLFSTWDVRLHILQSLEFIEISTEYAILVEEFVRLCLQDKNKFTRAWALHGFYILSNIIPEYRQELILICKRALELESPAIKAKARHILTQIAI